jgi:8-oxo-dGTP diphosphatase
MVGVGAVIFREDTVLLVERGREPSCGKWSLPGGLVEVGESLQQAVKREVLEEVGLEVSVGDLVAVLDRVILDPKGNVEYHYVLLDFLCECGQGAAIAATDVTRCAFVPLSSLSQYSLTEGTEQVIRRAVQCSTGERYPAYDPHL